MNNHTHLIIILSTAFVAAAAGAASATVFLHFSSNAKPSPVTKYDMLQRRLYLLENQLKEERAERIALQTQLPRQRKPNTARLTEGLSQSNPELDTSTEHDDQDPALKESSQDTNNNSVRRQRQSRFDPDFRQKILTANGFNNEEAAWIIQQQSEAILDSLNAQYQAQREAFEQGQNNLSQSDRLRERIGDDAFEKYLEANNRATSVSVGSIINRSPAQNAGLQAGDHIIAYAGKRVFNIRDLNRQTLQGNVGESVLIEVERDGNPIQLTIPRGPVGVTSGRSGRR